MLGHQGRWAIIDHPEAVAMAAKLPPEIIENIQKVWINNRTYNAIAAKLHSYGLSHHVVKTLIDKFGNNALEILSDD